MPAVTQQHQETITHAGKKRRRDDDQQPNTLPYEAFFWKPPPLDLPLTNPALHSPSEPQTDHNVFAAYATPQHLFPARKHIPLPTPKRLKEALSDDASSTSLRRPRSLSPSSLFRSSPRSLQETNANSRPTPARHASCTTSSTTTTPLPLLSRCHICHRKPTRKADLDSFASCEGCGQRTCFVCLRECLGWRTTTTTTAAAAATRGGQPQQRRWNGYGSASFHMRDAEDVAVAGEDEEDGEAGLLGVCDRGEGEPAEGRLTDGWATGGHRQKICSRCCVERGADGEVVCLGCLPFVEG